MSTNGANDWRTGPMYTFSEAAHLADVSPGTVRNWLFGYSTRDRETEPLFSPPADQGAMVSFIQLIEIVVAGRLRKAERASYRTVYQAYQNARQHYHYEYPFAHIALTAIGKHIVHYIRGTRPGASLQALDALSQWTIPGLVEIQAVVDQLDYEHELASKWWPVGRDVPIVVDPQFSSGVPTIAGRGVTVGTIHKRFTEGNLGIDFIMGDYQLEREQVEHAIRFGERLAA